MEKHRDEAEAWITEGIARLKVLEDHLAEAPYRLDADQVARFIRLSDAIRERAARSAPNYAQLVKRLKKQSRAFAAYSVPASDFVADLALRIEASLGDELEFLMDVSDNYRALARQYGPEQVKSEAFTQPAAAVAYLKSA